ncbi:hypothetical protein BLNAU_5036 [Blattamonas nauphoetae]|uniref:Uncharacterized protein n=1 Tax=Blattamonas nauphoetae TaxID=2049346 RepID=A0ABQ9Y8S5_9EUKA|nr:hypothetical protein BLNAU_5036 [Blattamonas nauphoetae]
MEKETETLNSSNDASLNCSTNTPSTAQHEEEPFLAFDSTSELSFDDLSRIYCSLVALVKAERPFDDVLLDRAAQFMKSLEPRWGDDDYAVKLVTDLVPSSAGPSSGFVESIVTLVSSPHSTVVAAALSFVRNAQFFSSFTVRDALLNSDLITKVLTTIQPHTLQISGNEEIFDELINVVRDFIDLAHPLHQNGRGITAAVDAFNHREMILKKVVLPSSPFVAFLISKRYILLNERLSESFMDLLFNYHQICPFHRPTLEFVLASPIVMAFSSCLSFIEDENCLERSMDQMVSSLTEWMTYGPDMVESGKRMMQALISEGFEDTLEQILIYEKNGGCGNYVVLNYLEHVQTSSNPSPTDTHFMSQVSYSTRSKPTSTDQHPDFFPSVRSFHRRIRQLRSEESRENNRFKKATRSLYHIEPYHLEKHDKISRIRSRCSTLRITHAKLLMEREETSTVLGISSEHIFVLANFNFAHTDHLHNSTLTELHKVKPVRSPSLLLRKQPRRWSCTPVEQIDPLSCFPIRDTSVPPISAIPSFLPPSLPFVPSSADVGKNLLSHKC